MGPHCEFGYVVLGLIWLEWPFQVCIEVFKEHAYGFERKKRKMISNASFNGLLLAGQ